MSDWKPRHPPIYSLALKTDPPITDPGGEKCKSLPIWRRIKAKDLISAEDKGLLARAENLHLLQCITGFDIDQLKELDAFDMTQATALVNALLVTGPELNLGKYISGLLRHLSQELTSMSLPTED